MIHYCSSFDDGVTGVPASQFAGGVVGFAGSRHLCLPASLCQQVVSFFADHGCYFAVGCCSGVDASFLSVLSSSHLWACRSSFFRAFQSRSSCGLHIAFTSPSALADRRRLGVRTSTFVRSCRFLVVFSTLPLGRGSSLAVRTAQQAGISVLVVSC